MGRQPAGNAKRTNAATSVDDMLDRTYPRLRALGQHLLSAASGQSVRGTELVHEAMVKLLPRSHFTDDRHFFNSVAQAMRQVLIDRQRARATLKRGGDDRGEAKVGWSQHQRSSMADAEQFSDNEAIVLEAIRKLGEFEPLSAEVLHLWVLGHSRADISNILSLSESRVRYLHENGLVYVRLRAEREYDIRQSR